MLRLISQNRLKKKKTLNAKCQYDRFQRLLPSTQIAESMQHVFANISSHFNIVTLVSSIAA